jgi:hypothetical protein
MTPIPQALLMSAAILGRRPLRTRSHGIDRGMCFGTKSELMLSSQSTCTVPEDREIVNQPDPSFFGHKDRISSNGTLCRDSLFRRSGALSASARCLIA